jgi:hypothetical protein
MTKLTFISVVGISLSCAALAHEGHEHGVVRERMEMMTDMGKRLLAISKRLRANKELDRITADARAIHELAGKITAQFPPGRHNLPRQQSLWSGSNGTTLARRPENCKAKLRSCQRPAHLTETPCGSNFGLLLMHATAVTKPIGSQKGMSDDVRYWPLADIPITLLNTCFRGVKADCRPAS